MATLRSIGWTRRCWSLDLRGNRLFLYLVAAVLAPACTSRAPVTATAPSEPTDGAAAQPSATHEPTLTPLATARASSVPTPTQAEFVPEPDFFERSPDGQWTASSFGIYPPSWMQVELSDGSVVWEVESDGEGWFEVLLRPVHWSVDGRYLYFTLAPYVDGFVLYMDGSGLQRLDLDDGQVTEVLASEGELQSFSISPASDLLAYVRSAEGFEWLILRDLGTGEERQWKLTDAPAQAGSFSWSPNASELVLLVTQGFSQEEALTDLVLVDLRSGTQERLLEQDPRIFYRMLWIDEHTLYLEDWTVTGWSLDLQTGEMILTPTPIPTSGP